MKNITIFILSLSICIHANSQTETTIQKTKTATVNTTQKPLTLQQQGEKNIPVPKLPDLRFTTVNVKMFNSQSAENKFLEISYTIKNDGYISIALNTLFVEGVIRNDGGQPGPGSYAGCGAMATALTSIKLNAGEEYSGSYRCYIKLGVAQCKSYTVVIDSQNAIKEIDENNNVATTTILIQ